MVFREGFEEGMHPNGSRGPGTRLADGTPGRRVGHGWVDGPVDGPVSLRQPGRHRRQLIEQEGV